MSAAFLSLGLPACASDDGSDDGTGTSELPVQCVPIRDACHEKDPGDGGEISQCHETSHEGTGAECAEVSEECIALCDAAPAVEGGHDHDHDHDHGGLDGG
jgi:hypothetical protein